MDKLEAAKRTLDEALARRAKLAEQLREAEAEELTVEAVAELETEFDTADEAVTRARSEFERQERLSAAISAAPATGEPAPAAIVVTRNEPVYRKGGQEGPSYFIDLYRAQAYMDQDAISRLVANNRHREDVRKQRSETEERTPMDSSGGAGFNPPIWMADEWAEYARPGRPVADRMPKLPLPTSGLTAHIPKVSTGATVDTQTNEGDGVSSTNPTSTTADASLVTIAGQVDVDRQILERSLPGLDMVIFDDLVRAYDSKLDTQVLAGSGTGQFTGLANVSSINSVTYNDASPTGMALLTQIYAAISQVYSKRYYAPTAIYMHPRRAAWIAATQSSTFPILQQGGLFHAAGTQDDGVAGTIAGLPVVIDANIPTNLGATTNADEIFVVYEPDFRLAEGALRQATYEDVLSGNLAVRLQVFAYAFFWGNRFAQSISLISGTGLVAPQGF